MKRIRIELFAQVDGDGLVSVRVRRGKAFDWTYGIDAADGCGLCRVSEYNGVTDDLFTRHAKYPLNGEDSATEVVLENADQRVREILAAVGGVV